MKILTSTTPPDLAEPITEADDVMVISQALLDLGYAASPYAIRQAWTDYSESLCAGWIAFDDPDWAAQVILDYMKETV